VFELGEHAQPKGWVASPVAGGVIRATRPGWTPVASRTPALRASVGGLADSAGLPRVPSTAPICPHQLSSLPMPAQAGMSATVARAGRQQRMGTAAGGLPVRGRAGGAGVVRGICWRGGGLLRFLSRTCRREPPVSGLFNPCDPQPADRSPSGPPASGHRRLVPSGDPRPLAVLDRSFRLLVCEPAPLALDGRAVGHGLPARPIPLDALRRLLLDSAVGFDARDNALSWLVQQAQAEGGAWLVGLAGVLLPGIGRRVYPLCRGVPPPGS